jgi:hypothetical protein
LYLFYLNMYLFQRAVFEHGEHRMERACNALRDSQLKGDALGSTEPARLRVGTVVKLFIRRA